MQTDMIPPTVAARLAEMGVVEIHRVPPGMSGASLYRCTCNDRSQWALKQWPLGTSERRVDDVHRVMVHARQSGCEIVPELHSWQPGPLSPRADSMNRPAAAFRWTIGGQHWERMQWMPGEPLGTEASLEEIRAGAAAIESFHRSVAELGVQQQPAPAITARLKRLQELDKIIPTLKLTTDLDPQLTDLVQSGCQLLSWQWTAIAKEIRQRLRDDAARPVGTQYVLRDVHREHVLFDGDRVSGVIDFDALRIDTPLSDLARWAFDFVAYRDDEDAIWEAVMAGCLENRPSKWYGEAVEAKLDVARRLYRATLWISLANWLQWILVQRRHFVAGPEKIAARLHLLIQGATKDVETGGES